MRGSVHLAAAACIVWMLLPLAGAASSGTSDSESDKQSNATAAESSAEKPVTAEQIANGKRLYRSYCARCHGLNMVSSSSAYYDLRRFPKDNRARFVSSVTNGKRAMPAWKNRLSDTQMEALWQYVLSGG